MKEYEINFELQPHDYEFQAGSRIGLVVVMSTDRLFTLRPPAGTKLTLRSPAKATRSCRSWVEPARCRMRCSSGDELRWRAGLPQPQDTRARSAGAARHRLSDLTPHGGTCVTPRALAALEFGHRADARRDRARIEHSAFSARRTNGLGRSGPSRGRRPLQATDPARRLHDRRNRRSRRKDRQTSSWSTTGSPRSRSSATPPGDRRGGAACPARREGNRSRRDVPAAGIHRHARAPALAEVRTRKSSLNTC